MQWFGDSKKLEQNVDRYSRTPIAGIVVQGSTGEAIMASDQEKRDALRVAREAAAPGKVLIAGVGVRRRLRRSSWRLFGGTWL